MRKTYRVVLKRFFHSSLTQERVNQGLTQSEMAQKLCMDDRSYIDLDHGKACCSAVTLALFLIYVCDNPLKFLENLRYAFEAEFNYVA